MGEVYLAEDTLLHRKVALKILPVDLAANKDRMRRFEQRSSLASGRISISCCFHFPDCNIESQGFG